MSWFFFAGLLCGIALGLIVGKIADWFGAWLYDFMHGKPRYMER